MRVTKPMVMTTSQKVSGLKNNDANANVTNADVTNADVTNANITNKALSQPSFKREKGFTLIEVMVALAILAVVAVAASRASTAYLNSVEVLRTRTLAHFVAQNVAADIRIQGTWLTANSTQSIKAQGRDWQVIMTPSNTLSPTLKAVNISVAPVFDGQARAAVADIDMLISNTKLDMGSLDLASLNQAQALRDQP